MPSISFCGTVTRNDATVESDGAAITGIDKDTGSKRKSERREEAPSGLGIVFSRDLADAVERGCQLGRFRHANSEIRFEAGAQGRGAGQMTLLRLPVGVHGERIVAESIAGSRSRPGTKQRVPEERPGMVAEIPVRDFVIGRKLRFKGESVEGLPFAAQTTFEHEAIVQRQ